jgi:adenosylmethionine-8-amino-7-oxononanoate aminotransferase
MSGHTYSANPQSAAISLAALDYIDNNRLVQAAKAKGQDLLERLRRITESCEIIGDVRGKGLLLGIEFVSDRKSKRMFPPKLSVTSRIVDKAFQKGLLIYPAAGGVDGAGDAILIAPPFIINDEEMDLLVRLFSETVQEIMQEVKEAAEEGI